MVQKVAITIEYLKSQIVHYRNKWRKKIQIPSFMLVSQNWGLLALTNI